MCPFKNINWNAIRYILCWSLTKYIYNCWFKFRAFTGQNKFNYEKAILSVLQSVKIYVYNDVLQITTVNSIYINIYCEVYFEVEFEKRFMKIYYFEAKYLEKSVNLNFKMYLSCNLFNNTPLDI